MTDRDDAGSEQAARRVILKRQEQAYQAQELLKEHEPDVPPQVKREAAIKIDNFRDVLVNYHNERALEVPWGERAVDVDILGEYLSRTTIIEVSLGRRGDATVQEKVPKIAELTGWQIRRIAHELHLVAKELGFAASAKEKTPRTEATHEDLYALLQARGQEEALGNLPGTWGDDEAEPVEEVAN